MFTRAFMATTFGFVESNNESPFDYELDQVSMKLALVAFSSSAPSFSLTFDPVNPVGIRAVLMDFVTKERDILLKDKVEQEIVVVVRIANEKEKKKKKLETEKREKEVTFTAVASSIGKKAESKEPREKEENDEAIGIRMARFWPRRSFLTPSRISI